MTLRVSIRKFEKTRNSSSCTGIQTDIYRCELVDLQHRAFIVLKYPKKKTIRFEPGDKYLADKIRLIINKLGEIVLMSTAMTVLRVETDETHTIESMELSQK